MWKKIKSSDGQALVEFALILPIMILILFGIIEFGRVFSAQLLVTNGARDGARIAAVGATDLQVEAAAKTGTAYLDPAKVDIDIKPEVAPDEKRNRGDYVTVEVSYPVTLYIPIISDIIKTPSEENPPVRVVNSKLVMRVE